MSRARRRNPDRLTVADIQLRIKWERAFKASRDEVLSDWQRALDQVRVGKRARELRSLRV